MPYAAIGYILYVNSNNEVRRMKLSFLPPNPLDA